MITISLSLANPWAKEDFKSIYEKWGKISENKGWEVQVYKHSRDLFEFSFNFSWRGTDHAGADLTIGLFGYVFTTNIHDGRHWDYDNNCWMTYENETKTLV